MDNQTLNFMILYSGAWWFSPADIGFYVNDVCIEKSPMAGKPFTTQRKTFTLTVPIGWNSLRVRLEKKTPADLYKDPTTGQIIRNKFIEVKQIYINEFGFSPGDILRLDGNFVKDSDRDKPIKSCIIYDQGDLVFKFKTPFEYWALQTMVTS